MTAKQKAEREARQRDERLMMSAQEGLKEALGSPNGRAFIWVFYSTNADAEGEEGAGRRAAAREILRAARRADFDGLQTMREEHERVKPLAQAETLEEGEEE